MSPTKGNLLLTFGKFNLDCFFLHFPAEPATDTSPAAPLTAVLTKCFLLPTEGPYQGIPACDLYALGVLDEFGGTEWVEAQIEERLRQEN